MDTKFLRRLPHVNRKKLTKSKKKEKYKKRENWKNIRKEKLKKYKKGNEEKSTIESHEKKKKKEKKRKVLNVVKYIRRFTRCGMQPIDVECGCGTLSVLGYCGMLLCCVEWCWELYGV